MATQFLYFQSVVKCRIPIVDGVPQAAEVVSKFVTEPKEQKRADTKAAKQKLGPIGSAVEEVEYAD